MAACTDGNSITAQYATGSPFSVALTGAKILVLPPYLVPELPATVREEFLLVFYGQDVNYPVAPLARGLGGRRRGGVAALHGRRDMGALVRELCGSHWGSVFFGPASVFASVGLRPDVFGCPAAVFSLLGVLRAREPAAPDSKLAYPAEPLGAREEGKVTAAAGNPRRRSFRFAGTQPGSAGARGKNRERYGSSTPATWAYARLDRGLGRFGSGPGGRPLFARRAQRPHTRGGARAA